MLADTENTASQLFSIFNLEEQSGCIIYLAVIMPVDILELTEMSWREMAIGQNEFLYGNLLFKI